MNEIQKAMQGQAEMMASYVKALVKQGFSRDEAIAIAVQWQDANVHASAMATVERELRLMADFNESDVLN